jgi:hypothetical protein
VQSLPVPLLGRSAPAGLSVKRTCRMCTAGAAAAVTGAASSAATVGIVTGGSGTAGAAYYSSKMARRAADVSEFGFVRLADWVAHAERCANADEAAAVAHGGASSSGAEEREQGKVEEAGGRAEAAGKATGGSQWWRGTSKGKTGRSSFWKRSTYVRRPGDEETVPQGACAGCIYAFVILMAGDGHACSEWECSGLAIRHSVSTSRTAYHGDTRMTDMRRSGCCVANCSQCCAAWRL